MMTVKPLAHTCLLPERHPTSLRRAPFSAAGASDASIEAAITRGAPVEFPSRMSDAARSFITAALHKAPTARPTIVQMLQHPWIRSFQVCVWGGLAVV
jgi:serine/threonine protein kinase